MGKDRAVKRLSYEEYNISQSRLNALKNSHNSTVLILLNIGKKDEFPVEKISDLFRDYESILLEIHQNITESEENESKSYLRHCYNKYLDVFFEAKEYVSNDQSLLFNRNVLWLNGEAGQGKTHLLCDVASNRMQEKKPAIILFGTNFSSSTNIWKNICKNLNLHSQDPRKSFFNYIERLSRKSGERVLLIVDAINESPDVSIWIDELFSFVNEISKSEKIAVCLSCRSTYESLFDLRRVENKIIKLTHHGFKNNLVSAVREYFSHYKIKYSEIPLATEFANPLFLRVYCKTLNKEKKQGPYRGHKGMKYIMENFFHQVDRLKIRKKVEYGGTLKLSWNFAKYIAEEMAQNATDFLAVSKAKELENRMLKDLNNRVAEEVKFKPVLLEAMIHEGLLIKDNYSEDNLGVIRFPYQKFSDHLIARYILKKYLHEKNENYNLDVESEELKNIFREIILYKGLICAISAQIPERTRGKDLIDFFDNPKRQCHFSSYLNSLIWRDPSTIKDTGTVINNFNEMLKRNFNFYRKEIFNTLISLSTTPWHPLNAMFLNKILKSKKIIDRDYLWTEYINEEFQEEETVVNMVVKWGRDDIDISSINSESVELLTICLSWFFTASNRHLRDKATKSLVKVISESLLCSTRLIDNFIDVDDPYILERIVTSIYGAIIINDEIGEAKKNKMIKICESVYKNIFLKKKPLNILTLYYSERILKLAAMKGCSLDFIDWSKTKAPFGFEIPEGLPSIESLKESIKDYPRNDPFNKKWGLIAIKSSVLSSGDFARYVIGTDAGYIDWDDGEKTLTKNIEKDFYASLSIENKKTYEEIRDFAEVYEVHELFSDVDSIKEYEKLKNEFIEELPRLRREEFEKTIEPYLRNKKKYKEEGRIKTELLQRYIMWRVLDIGYKIDLFGRTDAALNRENQGRDSHKVERVGKKYQWIAYFEILAIINDKYKYRQTYASDVSPKILDLSQFKYIDQIDPTVLMKKKSERPGPKKVKEIEFKKSNIKAEIDDMTWLKNRRDKYSIDELVEVQFSNEEWLLMHGVYDFLEDISPEEDRYSKSRKKQFYSISSYLYKKKHEKKVNNFLKTSNFIGGWMPERTKGGSSHFREPDWDECLSSKRKFLCSDEIPFPYQMTHDSYSYELRTYDCSIEESTLISMPSHSLMKGMKLDFDKTDGFYIDSGRALVAIDLLENPTGLLMSKRHLQIYLRENNLGIFWTLISEKNHIGGDYYKEEWLGKLKISQGMTFDAEKYKIFRSKIDFSEPPPNN